MSRPSMENFRKKMLMKSWLFQVVKVKSITGDGTGEPGHSPICQIKEYFTLDGELLAREISSQRSRRNEEATV